MSVKIKRTVIKLYKKQFVTTCDTDLNIAQIRKGLDDGFLHIEAYRIVDGPMDERFWRTPDGESMGRLAVRYNNNCRVIEVESQGQQGLINAAFPKWLEDAKKKYIHEHKPLKVKAADVIKPETAKQLEKAAKINEMLAEINKYMHLLKDAAEIGALWKFAQYLGNKK
jgi:hypothetical protein